MRIRRSIAGVLLAIACLHVRPALAQSVDTNQWVTNGTVSTVVRDGNTLYVGGSFTKVSPAYGGGAPLDAATGALPPSFPKVAGAVNVAVSDGAGGWYIGGSFIAVGGLARSNLAHIASDFSVTSWNPGAVSADVHAMAISGSTVYVGGDFSQIGAQTRNRIAAIDGVTGSVTAWNPNADLPVRALVVSGSTVYAGGDFTNIGGQLRPRIAALDATTGNATAWNPSANQEVLALAVSGSTVYAGGFFTGIGGQPRNYIAALDATSGSASTWNPNCNGNVYAIAVSGSLVYVGGYFGTIGGQTRSCIAALDATTGAATSWDPNVVQPGNVNAILVSGSTVYAGGAFTNIGGQAVSQVAALDATTGLATAWSADPNSAVNALALGGSSIYVGGVFTGFGGSTRNNVAAFDVTTGVVTSWNPNANQIVRTLTVSGATVYAGGDFTTIGGQTRNRIAALNTGNGQATGWNPNADATVWALLVNGTTVYAGGQFTNIGGQTRSGIAALATTNGLATAWDPNANSYILCLALSGSTIYAGGNFNTIGGQARNRIAALDVSSGLATAWDPNANNLVRAFLVKDTQVIVGGSFTTIGGQTRLRIASLDATSGLATGWNPSANNPIYCLAQSGTTVYAGGAFSFIGGQARNQLAALDAGTGLAAAWNPSATLSVYSVAVSRDKVHAGGDYSGVGVLPQTYLSTIAAQPALTAVVPKTGGNAGLVTVTLNGSGLAAGSGLKLSRSGQPDIVATNVVIAADAASMTGTLNLAGALSGAWDVVVTGPDLQTATLVGGFAVTDVLLAPQLRVALVGTTQQSGSPVVRRDRRTAFDLVIENPGNVDALSVPLWLAGIPLDATLALDFPLSYPPQAGVEPDWTTVPVTFSSAAGKYVPLVIPWVPPGTTTRRIYLTVPGPTHAPFTLTAAITPPWVDGNKFRSCITAGGVGNPTCMGPQLDAINAYLSTNATSIVAMSGIAIWAKEAWQCEGSGTLSAALVKAEQVLDYLEAPVEGGGAAAGCEDVLLTRWRDSRTVNVVASVDPNDKLGAQGTLAGRQVLPYSIRFENFATATAAAQDVVISDQLNNTTMDLTTVSLDRITFGGFQIQPPPGLSNYSTVVDMRPAKNLLVNVAVSLDPFTHVLSWYFNSIDPVTGTTPTNTANGFLPPNVTAPEGEGSVLFTVMPKAGATSISNAASILFDDPPATNTSAWANGIDQSPPASHVLPLSGQSNQPTITVSWALDASAPDLRDYTIYVKEDAGPYRVWRLNTTATSDTLKPPPDHHFHNYSFYSVARDQIGNIEAAPASPPDPGATTQSTTAVGDPAPPRLALEGARPNPAMGEALTVAFSLPSAEPATLELIDLAGRRVARREVGHLGPGSHVVDLEPRPSLRAGLYFVRLTQAGQVLHARTAVIR